MIFKKSTIIAVKVMVAAAIWCAFCHNATAQTADGVEDVTDFPVDYWVASYYEGASAVAGSSFGDTGPGGVRAFRGEAFFGIGTNDVTIASNGTANSNRWSNSETPTSPLLHTPDYVGAVWTGVNPTYQIDLRRKAANGGTLTFGFGAGEVVDDIVDVYVNGVRQYAYFPSGGAPDPRPGAGVGATINVNAGDEILFAFQNRGFIGGFTFRFLSPPLPDPVVAIDDSASVVSSGAVQTSVLQVGDNDTQGGAGLPATAVYFVEPGSTVPSALTFNTSTGHIDVAANAAAGTYQFDYRVCEDVNEFSCDTATATVTITAPSPPQPFTCISRFYEVIDGQMARFDPVSQTYIPIGSQQLLYNGTGYNTLDNYVYAFGREGDIDQDLIRVGNFGNIVSLAENVSRSAAADMGADGKLYYFPRASTIRRVSVTPPYATENLILSGTPGESVLDIAYIEFGGKDYFAGARNGRVYVWNITDLTVFSFPVTGLPTGTYGAAWTASNGNLYVAENTTGIIFNIENPITAPEIIASYTAAASSQHDGFSCPTAAPPFINSTTLIANKTTQSYPAGAYQLPGNDVLYTISVDNTGTAKSDNNSMFIVDTLPPEITMYIGDIDDAGPQTDPVTFQSNGSDLTFNYASDVGYSDLAAAPSDFSSCAYTPALGYDPNVKHVCFNPKGRMAYGDPDPSFSLTFRARIK